MITHGRTSPPVALTLAGSDCSAGAGLQADLKTFSALGIYGLTVVTSVIAEAPGVVTSVQPLTPKLVLEQYDLLLQSYPVAALKTGLLGSRDVIEQITGRLAAFPGPVVIDPVSAATAGRALTDRGYPDALRNLILQAADLITPNRAEAELLLGQTIGSAPEAREAAQHLASRFNCAVLLKGGHFDTAGESVDWLAAGNETVPVRRARLPGGTSLHGTGCTYAAAITAHLARGSALHDAVEAARTFLHAACEHPYAWERRDHSVTKALAHEGARVQI